MPFRRHTLLLTSRPALRLFSAVAWTCLALPLSWAGEPVTGGMLSEIALVALLPKAEPIAVAPRVSFAENWRAGEVMQGEHHSSAGSCPLFHDRECPSTPLPIPAVPRWSEEVGVCPSVTDDRTERFDFLCAHRGAHLTPLDLPTTVEQQPVGFGRSSRGYELPPPDQAIAQYVDAPLSSQTTLEPLLIYATRRRPVAPSGTMYLWSTTRETRVAQGHAAGSASAGVVLTRPPGDYSVDWLGVAVTAPIQWR